MAVDYAGLEARVTPQLGADREVVVQAVALMVDALGSGDWAGRLTRRGAVIGPRGSIARSLSADSPRTRLFLTPGRVLLVDTATAAIMWAVPRDQIRGVQKRPRLQLLARFRLHFADGSSIALLTPRRTTIERLGDLLGRV